jgi:hypothetical protein
VACPLRHLAGQIGHLLRGRLAHRLLRGQLRLPFAHHLHQRGLPGRIGRALGEQVGRQRPPLLPKVDIQPQRSQHEQEEEEDEDNGRAGIHK